MTTEVAADSETLMILYGTAWAMRDGDHLKLEASGSPEYTATEYVFHGHAARYTVAVAAPR